MDTSLPSVSLNLAPLLSHCKPTMVQSGKLFHDARLYGLWQNIITVSGVQCTLTPLADRVKPVAFHGVYRLDCVCDQGDIVLALACDDVVCGALALQQSDDPLHIMALEVVFADVVHAMAQHALPGFRMRSLQILPAEMMPGAGWYALRESTRELARLALLEIAPDVLGALLAKRALQPEFKFLRSMLQVPLMVILHQRSMTLDALRRLSVGDVVLLGEQVSPDAPFPARIHAQGVGRALMASTSIASDRITFMGAFSTMEDEEVMAATDGQPPDYAPGTSIDALDIPVHFEIETISISLSELESIQPGYIIELGSPLTQARLRLVACGAVIGDAELVAVGSRLGARIVRMVPGNDADNLAR